MNVGRRRLLSSTLRKGAKSSREAATAASARISDDEYAESELRCWEAFKVFDKRERGFVKKKDLTLLFRSMGQNPTDSEVEDMINEVDATAGRGRVRFEDFVHFFAKTTMRNLDPEDEVRECYYRFAPANEGINTEELRFVLTNLPVRLSKCEVQEVIQATQTACDGRISYEEFRIMMTGKQQVNICQ